MSKTALKSAQEQPKVRDEIARLDNAVRSMAGLMVRVSRQIEALNRVVGPEQVDQAFKKLEAEIDMLGFTKAKAELQAAIDQGKYQAASAIGHKTVMVITRTHQGGEEVHDGHGIVVLQSLLPEHRALVEGKTAPTTFAFDDSVWLISEAYDPVQ